MELIPLQIPAGWTVVQNHFYDIDYESRVNRHGMLAYPFHEDMLLIRNASLRLSIDLGWTPDGDPHGSYKLQLLSWEPKPNIFPTPKQRIYRDIEGTRLEYCLSVPVMESWDHPLVEFESKSRFEIQAKINEFLRREHE